jgi:hypothetical protein
VIDTDEKPLLPAQINCCSGMCKRRLCMFQFLLSLLPWGGLDCVYWRIILKSVLQIYK